MRPGLDDHNFSIFEKLSHYYAVCKDDTDKFLLTFTLKKLGMVEGKLMIYAATIIQAYRLKFFFNRFQIKAFVLAPEMAKA